ncbi:AraC family transcriptional regulator [Isobaculum melis]|uniref:AraC-type DNA-binding protein n=1 Tax=Isobaculum melis TaxID=142588 RepID=A0A1H9Q4P8_9LACT|nr:AraC family transcriptional regulator [Isobaculum melis]SER54833.1 AraC-type DNA-binding protein [Isobaculum melis]
MSRTIYESVQMDNNLPMRILHFSHEKALVSPGGNTYHFDTATLQFVPPHWHRSIELTYVVNGTLQVRQSEQEQTYQDDSFFIINSGDIHELSSVPTDNFELICFIISYDFIQQFIPNIEKIRFDMATTQETAAELSGLFYDILTLYNENQEFGHLKIQARLIEILYLLCQYHQVENHLPASRKYLRSQQLNKQILEYIHVHYMENLTLERLAKTFNFSREHFSRLFKETFGKTFLVYLNDYRLYCAFPEIVNSRKTIEAISIAHGFPSSKALIKQFKEVYHETPMQFRKNRKVSILDHNDDKKR